VADIFLEIRFSVVLVYLSAENGQNIFNLSKVTRRKQLLRRYLESVCSVVEMTESTHKYFGTLK